MSVAVVVDSTNCSTRPPGTQYEAGSSRIFLIKPAAKLSVRTPVFQRLFPTHRFSSICEFIVVDQCPRTLALGPTAFIGLMLFHPPRQISCETDVEASTRVVQHVYEKHIHSLSGSRVGSPSRPGRRTYGLAVNSSHTGRTRSTAELSGNVEK